MRWKAQRRSGTRVSGVITVVQETRFRLLTATGQSLILTLAHNANLTPEALCRLLEQRAVVVVDYQGEAGLASGTATWIWTPPSRA